MRSRWILGTGLLLLTTGCISAPMGGATAIPHPRTLPTLTLYDLKDSHRGVVDPPSEIVIPADHPPDATVVAREPHVRWKARLYASLVRNAPPPEVNWALLGLVIAF